MLQHTRQRVRHVLLGLETVVKHHDRAGPARADSIAQTGFGGEIPVIINRENIPHNNAVAGKRLYLAACDAPVGRPEQRGSLVRRRIVALLGKHGAAIVYILDITLARSLPAVKVIEGMIARSMIARQHLAIYIGVLAYIIAYTKEGSLGGEAGQCIEHELGRTGYRAVVKSKVELFLGSIDAPGKRGVKHRQKERRSVYHNL